MCVRVCGVFMVTKVILLPRKANNIPQQHINTVFSNQRSVWRDEVFYLSPVFFSPRLKKLSNNNNNKDPSQRNTQRVYISIGTPQKSEHLTNT